LEGKKWLWVIYFNLGPHILHLLEMLLRLAMVKVFARQGLKCLKRTLRTKVEEIDGDGQ
jgi:hypothetical protein